MSVPVSLSDVPGVIDTAGQAFLVTLLDDGRAHVAGVSCSTTNGIVRVSCGKRSKANAAARPSVTMLFPAPRADGFVLLVDGDAMADIGADGQTLIITPTSAVLHKPSR